MQEIGHEQDETNYCKPKAGGICALLGKYAKDMNELETLALIGNIAGKVIAMQDQRKTTPEMAVRILLENASQGNSDLVNSLLNTKGNA